MNTQRDTHTATPDGEHSLGWAGSHYSLTHTEGLAELRKASCKMCVWGGWGLNFLTSPVGDPRGGTSCSWGCLHPRPALRGSRSLSSASAQPRGDPGKLLEGKGGRELLAVADGSSVPVLRHGECPQRGGDGSGGRERAVRVLHCPPPVPSPPAPARTHKTHLHPCRLCTGHRHTLLT